MPVAQKVSSRISTRSSLLLIGGILAIAAALTLIVFAGARSLQGTWSLAAVSILVISVLGIGTFLLTWPEVHRVAKKEQTAAVRRIASALHARESIQHQVLNLSQIAFRDDVGEIKRSTTVKVFLSRPDLFQFRSTIISGVRGAGKSTLMSRLATAVADETAAGRGDHWPLYVSAGSWASGVHLSAWVENEMSSTFRVRRRVTSAWLHSANSILFVDGVDDIETPAYLEGLLSSIAEWQRKPWGGMLVISATEAQTSLVAKKVRADRIAFIKAPETAATARLLKEILQESTVFSEFSNPKRLAEQLKFLEERAGVKGMTPSLVRAVERGTSPPEPDSSGTSAEWLRDMLAADVELENDFDRATSSYLRIAEEADSSIASVALMRATLVQAGMGQVAAAEVQFHRALEMFEDLHPVAVPRIGVEMLSPSERAVMRVIGGGRGLLEEEIVSHTALVPSQVRETLQGLTRKGFTYVREVGLSRTPFYESALVHRPDALGGSLDATSSRWRVSHK